MKTQRLTPFLLMAIFAAFLTACGPKSKDSKEMAKEQNDAKFDNSDEKKDARFATTVADIGNLEVQLGELAQRNATATKVKEFGQMMIDDHSKGNAELKDLASKKDISLPDILSSDFQKKYDGLATKHGKDFDKAYCEAMVKGHKDAISLFKKEVESGNDPDVRDWASGKVAVLEHHLQMARECDEAVAKLK